MKCVITLYDENGIYEAVVDELDKDVGDDLKEFISRGQFTSSFLHKILGNVLL